MGVERAVVNGTLGTLVQTRNMFTCNVQPQGGDTPQLLWQTYLQSIYNNACGPLSGIYSVYSYELQQYQMGSWVPYDLINYTVTGSQSTDYLPYQVAFVLIGKALGLRHIGRKFFSGVAENAATGNSLVGTTLADAAAACLAYVTPFTGIGGGTITPGVVDRAGVFHAFVGGAVSSLLGTMRRRKPGIGI